MSNFLFLFSFICAVSIANAKESLDRFDGTYDLKSADGSFKVNRSDSSKKVPASDICESVLKLKGEMAEYPGYLKIKPEPIITFDGINTDPIQFVGDRIHYFYDSKKHLNNNSPVSRFSYHGMRLIAKVFDPDCGPPLSRYSSSKNKLTGEREDWVSTTNADGKKSTFVMHTEKLVFEKKGDSLVASVKRLTLINPNEEPKVDGSAVCVYTKRK